MDTSSVRQVGNLIAWSAGPVTEDSDLWGKALPCAGSLPMGIMHGMRLSLLVKVKYFIQEKIDTLIKDQPFLIWNTVISKYIDIQKHITHASHENKA